MPDSIPPEVMDVLRQDDEANGAIRVHSLMDDDDAKTLIVYLAVAGTKWSTPETSMPPLADVAALWEWAWAGAEVDFDAARSGARLPGNLAESALSRIRAHRLAFPDGQPSKWARAVVEAEVFARIQKLGKKQPGKRSESK